MAPGQVWKGSGQSGGNLAVGQGETSHSRLVSPSKPSSEGSCKKGLIALKTIVQEFSTCLQLGYRSMTWLGFWLQLKWKKLSPPKATGYITVIASLRGTS